MYTGGADCYMDVESVTFTPKTGSPQSNVKGIHRSPSNRQNWVNQSFGADVADFLWILFADSFGTPPTAIYPDDKITDSSGVVYLINSVVHRKEIQQWECACIKQPN